jgi:hypothetical protein
MILSLAANETKVSKTAGQEEGSAGVDELNETLHNLTSPLLMNTTLHRRQQAVQGTKFFNNKQSISVGV